MTLQLFAGIFAGLLVGAILCFGLCFGLGRLFRFMDDRLDSFSLMHFCSFMTTILFVGIPAACLAFYLSVEAGFFIYKASF